MSSGTVHRRISRVIAAPTAVAIKLAGGDWYFAIVASVACALSGCGPDWDQAEAHLPLGWKVGAAVAGLVAGALWWME